MYIEANLKMTKQKDNLSLKSKTVINTSGHGKIIRKMAGVSMNGMMELFIKVNMQMEKGMEKEKWFIAMEISMREIGQMAINMEQVHLTLIYKIFREYGKRVNLFRFAKND